MLLVACCGLLAACATWVPAGAQETRWTGEGADNLWDNAENWYWEDVPLGGDIYVNGPEAAGVNGPLIAEGTEAIAGVLIADAGEPVLTMTGGSLELTGWGVWWGDASGTTATFNMSGGVVDFTGGPGIMELGWQNAGDPTGSSVGIWNMTGGEINTKGVDMPGKGNGGIGVINLWGGTLNVGVARGGLILYEGALIDITDGILVLEGDQTSLIENYVDLEYMTAHGGSGQLSIVYDDDYTTVTAISALRGDYNVNQQLDPEDLDWQAEVALGLRPYEDKYDETGDGQVTEDDRLVWLGELKKTWIGDADFDFEFNTADFVQVFTEGKYETGERAGWAQGDFTGDLLFDTADFVAAFTADGYEKGPFPGGNGGVAAVPEPGAILTGLLGAIGFLGLFGRRHPQSRA